MVSFLQNTYNVLLVYFQRKRKQSEKSVSEFLYLYFTSKSLSPWPNDGAPVDENFKNILIER